MDLGWYSLLIGLALGLLPPRWFYNEGCRHLTLLEARASGLLRMPGNSGSTTSGRRRRRWWKMTLLWIDPARGYLCGGFLAQGFAALPIDNAALALALRLLHVVTLLSIIALQMERGRQQPGQLIAPVIFLLGLTIGFQPNLAAVGAAVGMLSIATMLGTQCFNWGYMAAGAGALAIGFPFLGLSPSLAIFVAVASLPAPYAFMRRAKLVFPIRG